jgi:phosphopantetheinyl transferase
MSIEIEIHVVDLRCASLFAREELSEGELARANRFSSPLLAQRFTSSRVALRRLLGRRLGGTEPCNIPLAVGRYGKPRLDSNAPCSDVLFNSSRSKDMALIALAE